MTALSPPAVTLLIAAALGLINLWLGLRSSAVRMKRKIMMGDGGDPLMIARMRSNANFNEYVPMALILMALIELRVGPSTWLWIAGIGLVVARLLHPFGMERPAPNAMRAIGIALTLLVSLALVIWAIALSFSAGGSAVHYS